MAIVQATTKCQLWKAGAIQCGISTGLSSGEVGENFDLCLEHRLEMKLAKDKTDTEVTTKNFSLEARVTALEEAVERIIGLIE